MPVKTFFSLFFPQVCPACEKDAKSGNSHFCALCGKGFSENMITSPFCAVCGIPFQKSAGVDHACGKCLKEKTPFKEARSAFIYDGAVLEAIHSFKYRGRVILAAPLGRLAAQAAIFSHTPDVIMPVPLHKERLQERGFNQSLLIAKEVAKIIKKDVDYMNLKRERLTAPQVDLKAGERARNVEGAFALARPDEVKGKRVLLVDDVFTTGSTISECSKVLKKAGAEVFALTLARAVAL